MPLVTGLEFFEALRKKGCKCPDIALMSEHLIPRDVLERASKLNLKFFAKPFHRSQIDDWLKRIETRLLQERQAKGLKGLPDDGCSALSCDSSQ